MSTNFTDHKFGLPKPDFQALPKKKVTWRLLVIVGIIVLLVAAKVSYNFFFKEVKNPTSCAQAANNKPTTDQTTDTSKPSPSEIRPSTEVGANAHTTIHPSVCEANTFEHKQNNKIKKSISATQKQLAAKQSKSLVKPGTYQEVKEPQGIYHLVVVNHLDKWSAMKVVQQLMKNNLGVCLILPRIDKREKYYRVTIGHSKTRYEADAKLAQFKRMYNNIFILKY
ncbi:hypothetical protein [Cardinium endosymbiont of Oedothorax gibbosus]|uniref:hypothetical protein n=1 Tax=Cardinium endosymbiont of Oedothorax gibbosus TaxID=931101 RepID=UPI00202480E2|nr:hypothetical protein [Cardinium endosymbiont of Oedothorax gibbosus]CAH2559706.1 hypothetical protein CAOEGIBSW744_0171 [Cardinium endosymbiont of Oedothorax gibbosus]